MRMFACLIAVLALVGLAAGQGRVFATDGCIEKKPQPPVDLVASAKSATSIVVAWNSPTGNACVDSYTYVVIEKGKPEPRSTRPPAQSYSLTIDDLKPNTEYIVKVASVNSMKGNSEFAQVTVKTQKDCKPAKPGAIGTVFVNQASNSVAYLSWLPPSAGGCTDSYKIEGVDSATNKKVLNAQTTKPDVKAVQLQAGRQYTFRITALNNRGDGPTTRASYKMKSYGPPVVASGSVPAGRRLLQA